MTMENVATETQKAARKTNGKSNGKGAKKAAAKAARKGKGALKKKNRAKSKPTTGQSAPPIELKLDELNAKETKLLAAINGSGEGPRATTSITDLVKIFKNSANNNAQANSWVRNSLRRLVCASLIEKVERGKYRVTENGRRRFQRAEA